ncbi:hypothetical protein DdX_18097 [Ditylenchus destructor]|uniref:Uncharacterized protein n=1 Tax=Ditylenchus destructor TaxID=166010 RepID=A0AAD4MKJ3_9BILA|nr:hypothetical protein DdX_18097 [Ditylenchus destructor]
MTNSNSTRERNANSNNRKNESDDINLLESLVSVFVLLTIFIVIGIGFSFFLTRISYFTYIITKPIGYFTYYCFYAYILYLFREMLYFFARFAYGFFHSMYKHLSSLDWDTYGLFLACLAMFRQVLEYSYEWTPSKMAFTILIAINAYILYRMAKWACGLIQSMYQFLVAMVVSSAKESQGTLSTLLLNWWISVKSYFRKKDAYCDSILSTTIEIMNATHEILRRMAKWACGLVQSMYQFLTSPDVIPQGSGLLMVAIIFWSLDFYNRWTWFTLAFVVFIGYYISKLYRNAKESQGTLSKLLQNWWISVKSYFRKKDAYCDSILSTTIQIMDATREILLRIPETEQTLRETIGEIGNLAKILNEYTQKVGDGATELTIEFKQQMITCSENLNQLMIEQKKTAEIRGAMLERAEDRLNRDAFWNRISTLTVSLAKVATYSAAAFCFYDVAGLVGVLKFYTDDFMKSVISGINEGRSHAAGLTNSVIRGIDEGRSHAADLTKSVISGIDEGRSHAADLTKSVISGIDEGRSHAEGVAQSLIRGIDEGRFRPHVDAKADIQAPINNGIKFCTIL